ncbi:hypothetical protein HDV01_002534 [Terramyces sp. JEL0728]|nr:hypothetical protein HDV01_002534 [Terramyces sp. JEL0728]
MLVISALKENGNVIGCSLAAFAKQKEFEIQLADIEQRIKQMEINLLSPNNGILRKRDKVRPIIKHIALTPELEHRLFEEDHEHLLELRFERFPCVIFGIMEEFYRQSAKIFWPLRFALFASGALFITPDQLPDGVSDRIELVNLYLQKAQSFNFGERCDHLTVLTLEVICNIYINSTEEAILYFKLALQQARISGINSEHGISKISLFDYEKENIRRIWWILYRDYSFLCNIIGFRTMDDQENLLFLPSNKFYFESAHSSDYYGVEIMTSDEWYTACLPCQEVDGYHMLLQRIQSKMFHHFEIELSENDTLSLYSAGAINASLADWIHLFSPNLQKAFNSVRSGALENRETTWFTIYTAFVYCSIRVNLIIPTMIRNVIKGKKVMKQLYFKEAVESAVTSTNLIQVVIQFNPKLEFLAAAVLLSLFPTGFFLLCCAKMGIPKCEEYYKQLLDGIKKFSRAFQKLNQFYGILLLLQSKDLLEAVMYYGMFITRQNTELMERPAAHHIGAFAELDIK